MRKKSWIHKAIQGAALSGLIVLLAGIGLGYAIQVQLTNAISQAHALDRYVHVNGTHSGDNLVYTGSASGVPSPGNRCPPGLTCRGNETTHVGSCINDNNTIHCYHSSGCAYTLSGSIPPVMSKNETPSVTVTLQGENKDPCTVDVKLIVPTSAFTLNPPQTDVPVTLSAGMSSMNFGWILTSTGWLGAAQVIISTTYNSTPYDSQNAGVAVLDTFGLSVQMDTVLSYALPAAGTFFGPILTIPWWYERWKEHKRKKDEKANAIKQTPMPPLSSHTAASSSHAGSQTNVSEVCPYCNRAYHVGAHFCSNCGRTKPTGGTKV